MNFKMHPFTDISTGNLEKVLCSINKTVEFRQDMENIELVCNVEFNGSTSLKDIHILVCK